MSKSLQIKIAGEFDPETNIITIFEGHYKEGDFFIEKRTTNLYRGFHDHAIGQTIFQPVMITRTGDIIYSKTKAEKNRELRTKASRLIEKIVKTEGYGWLWGTYHKELDQYGEDLRGPYDPSEY